jgi:hypothetical protein
MAVIGLIAHIQDMSRGKRISNDTATTAANTYKAPWVGPDDAQKAKESMSSRSSQDDV